MKKVIIYSFLLLSAAVFIPQVSANNRHDNNRDDKDCKFLGHASNGALLWNLIGSIAQTNSTNFALPPGGLSQTNSTNAAVVGLGSLISSNHAVAFSNISVLQDTNGCRGTTRLTDKQNKAFRKIAKLTGPKFDKAFLAFVIEETTEAIDDYREAAMESRSAEVRAFARAGLVPLTQQLVDALAAGEAVFGGDFDDVDDD